MTQVSSSILRPRAVESGRGMAWLAGGFGYFQKDALVWIGVTILWFIIIMALALIPVLGNLAGQILMPVFIGGLITGCRERAQGGVFQVAHLFAGFGTHAGQLVILGLLYLAGIIAIVMLMIILIIFKASGTVILTGLAAGDVGMLRDNLMFMLLICLVAMALDVPLLMAFWFAPALVVLRNVSAVNAVKLSFNGCLVNIMPFILYGVIGLVLSVVAIIPIGTGLLVLIPMVMASIYVAYEDIYPEK